MGDPIRWFKHNDPARTFSPEEHAFLMLYNGQFLFPMKSTDRFSDFSAARLVEEFTEVTREQVPPHVVTVAERRSLNE